MSDPERAGGRLLVVSTPIGNLGDLSPRAREALETADRIACEDTRRTGALLAHLGLRRPMVSLHEHNERARLPGLLEELERGAPIALVSDAGTPLLSDPGFLLVREAVARGIRVEPVPGASALLTALVVSGLPPYPFTFGGFPPPRSGKRRTYFRRLAALEHSFIVYESPHRILPILEAGNRPVAVARELTKLHEEVLRGSLAEVRATLARRPAIKGELVVVVGPATEALPADGEVEADSAEG